MTRWCHDVRQDIPGEFLEDMMLGYYKANVLVSPAMRLDTESATRGQTVANEMASSMWMVEQRKRVTASMCGQIAKRRSTTKVAKLVKTLLYSTF